ncbi:MAG TPA: adaptor protein MecA [Pseudogracilibacillus sp.]|nr:adaptor protein MecA [Pseudogracilibacillus sp.]
MEIERINENTVKFYISYIDIEDRGFEREEIWYNRERSEQLFWQMMDEVNYKEDFNVDGPLWIQVQAMEKGLEIIVTKAQVSKDGEDLEIPDENGKTIDVSVDDKIENMLEDKFGGSHKTTSGKASKEKKTSYVFQLKNFEDVIQLSHYSKNDFTQITDRLFYYQDKYYLFMEFPDDNGGIPQDDIVSQIYEFADNTKITIHLLEAYGKIIFTNDTLRDVRDYFPA